MIEKASLLFVRLQFLIEARKKTFFSIKVITISTICHTYVSYGTHRRNINKMFRLEFVFHKLSFQIQLYFIIRNDFLFLECSRASKRGEMYAKGAFVCFIALYRWNFTFRIFWWFMRNEFWANRSVPMIKWFSIDKKGADFAFVQKKREMFHVFPSVLWFTLDLI